ncbi:hypothetical protein OAD54_01405 [Candidatus Pelagibacter sp.]|nr:hypothetical protein [Candidatus Pelagibacter sp.]
MATKIIHKKSTVAAKIPLVGDLSQGEIALNLTDKIIYTKDGGNNIIPIGTIDYNELENLPALTSGTVTSVATSGGLTGGTITSSGTISIADNGVTATKLNVTGNGTASQYLRSDGDGSFTWATPTDTNTTYSAGNGISLSSTTFSVAAGTGLTQQTSGLALSHLGIQSLIDPNDDRIMFWDDSAGAMAWLDIGSNLTLSGTTLSSTNTNTTYSAGNGISLSGTTFSVAGGTGLTQDASGLSVTSGGIGATQLAVTGNGTTAQYLRSDGDGTFTWATPTDTDTTYSAGSGISLVGTTFSHTDTSTQASVNNSGATVIQDVTLDTHGHVTGLASKTLTAADVGAAAYDVTTSSTGYFKVSVGTTAQRPTASVGMVRYNTTRGCFEGYTGSGWVNMSPITIGDVGDIV